MTKLRACIVAVGSEMLTPFRVDTNSLIVTDRLNAIGYDVRLKVVVGDDRGELAQVFASALTWADLIVVIGGLGPTDDDITRAAIAQVLEVPLDLHGYPVLLYDTAGLREADSLAEQEGVRRARRTAEDADLMLWLSDCEAPVEPPPDLPDRPLWRLSTKIDLAPPAPGSDLGISLITRSGLIELTEKLTNAAAESLGSGNALVTRQRQKESILQAVAALGEAAGKPDEVVADLLRVVSDAIGRLSGRVDVEDVLDRLFSEFCIGK